MPPVISVIIPVYNAGRYLDGAISSVLAQTFEDFEAVIVNDGSTDGSLERLRRFAASDRRLRIISRANTGLTVALNEAWRAATGEFVARMDSDDRSYPDRFRLQVEYLRSHPDCLAVGGQVRVVERDGRPVGNMFRLRTHSEIDSYHLHTRASAIAHPTVMMRRTALEAAGGYRKELEPAEDLDLWLRMADMGKLSNLPDVLLDYRVHPSSVSARRAVQQWQQSQRAAAEALRRRGLDVPAEKAAAPLTLDLRRLPAPQSSWANVALESGNYSSARRLAARGARLKPTSLAAWYVFLTAAFGADYKAARAGLQSLRGVGGGVLRRT